MNEAGFWEIIEIIRRGSSGTTDESMQSLLESLLMDLPADDVAEFQRILEEKELELYRYDLWAVVYIIQHGCSDDGFSDFRSWIVSHGKERFDRVQRQPACIAEFVGPDTDFEREALWQVARDVYEKKTGRQLPAFVTYVDRHPIGEDWEDADLPRLFPAIWEKFA